MAKALIWTRPAVDWQSDVSRIPSLSKFYHLPLTKQLKLNVETLPESNSIVIVTSVKAAKLIANNEALLSRVETCDCITFSQAVAQVLGILKWRLIDVNVAKDMLEELKSDGSLEGRRVYFLGAQEPAYPIVENLKKSGIDGVHLPLYRTEVLKNLSEADLKQLNGGAVICLGSPASVRSLAQIINDYSIEVNQMTIVCIGATTSELCDEIIKAGVTLAKPSLEGLVEEAEAQGTL